MILACSSTTNPVTTVPGSDTRAKLALKVLARAGAPAEFAEEAGEQDEKQYQKDEEAQTRHLH